MCTPEFLNIKPRNMLKEGATSTFEVWTKNSGNSTSLCHAWSSSPISAICEFPQVLDTLYDGSNIDKTKSEKRK